VAAPTVWSELRPFDRHLITPHINRRRGSTAASKVLPVVAATQPLAAAKRLKCAAVIDDGLLIVHGDARRASPVLLILVGQCNQAHRGGRGLFPSMRREYPTFVSGGELAQHETSQA
jgi:hypothetical protein